MMLLSLLLLLLLRLLLLRLCPAGGQRRGVHTRAVWQASMRLFTEIGQDLSWTSGEMFMLSGWRSCRWLI
jgi:hypothetical protein